MNKRSSFGHVFQPKGRNNWYLRIEWDGRRIVRLAGTTRTVAERNRSRVHSLLLDGKPLEEVFAEVFNEANGARMTFKELATLYLTSGMLAKKATTIAGHKKRINFLVRTKWASKFINRIQREEINRWVTERMAVRKPDDAGKGTCEVGGVRGTPSDAPEKKIRVTSGATVNRDISLASAIAQWGIDRGMCDVNPFRKVVRQSERGRKRETYLTVPEARSLLDAASLELRSVLLCALATGMRRGEIWSLNWSDVDFEQAVIQIQPEREKAGRGRSVPMTEELCACLQKLVERPRVRRIDGKDPVFVTKSGERWGESSLRQAFLAARSASKELAKEKRECLRFHDLRHTAASLMVTAGVPLYSVGKVLGHSAPQTTARYAHLAPEAERAAVQKLGAVLAAPTLARAEAGA